MAGAMEASHLSEPKSMHNNDQVGFAIKDGKCGRMNAKDDRISGLPDDLIYKILSFVNIQVAITTMFLSSRWRFIWTLIPYLNFSFERLTFWHRCRYCKFVSNVLSHLNDQIQVSSVKIHHIRPTFGLDSGTIKKIVIYAVSHNVQQLTCYLGVNEIPISVFSSKSLKHLTFGGPHDAFSCTVSPTWELPALTTLHLDFITLSNEQHYTDKCIDLFSKCPNLKNLSLRRCKIKGTNVFDIFHPGISNLTLEEMSVEVINVFTPKLKNLTIRFCHGKHMISALGLTSLVFKGDHALRLSTDGFPLLEKVDLFIRMPTLEVANKMVCVLQQLHNIKFLTVNLNLLKFLCSSTELISHQPRAFTNLKISKFSTIYKGKVYMEAQEREVMTTELKSQNTSPIAIFTMVSCEEIEVMMKMVLALELIDESRARVKLCKGNRDHMTGFKRKRGKVQVKKNWVQSTLEMQWHFEGMMAQIEQEKIDGLLTKELPTSKTRRMISRLQCIEGLLTMISRLRCIEGLLIELPASKSTTLQATFSEICEEAAILMNNMMDGMKQPVILRSSHLRKLKLNKDPLYIYE